MIPATPFPRLRGLTPFARGDVVPAFRVDQHGTLPDAYAGSDVPKTRAAGGFSESGRDQRRHGARINRRLAAIAAGKEIHVSQPAEQGSNNGC